MVRLPRWVSTELFLQALAAWVRLEYRDFRCREDGAPGRQGSVRCGPSVPAGFISGERSFGIEQGCS
jgi:hypothetical protein